MKLTRRLSFKLSIVALALGTVMAGTMLTLGQQAQNFGLVDDWTTHHVIFSNPGTAVDALAQGRLAQWYRTVTGPRYIMQQMRRNPAPRTSEAAPGFVTLTGRLSGAITEPPALPVEKSAPRAPAPRRDWAFPLGGGTVAQNMYPAKYTFSPTGTPNCTSDFVVYGLNVAASGTQANMVALHNLYTNTGGTGYCSGTAPTVYWAYQATNHGGTITTSPVLSGDGSKVIYVESTSSASYLHVLVWNSSDGGIVGSPKTPTNSETAVGSCPSGSPQPSCLVTISLGTPSTTSVTNSSPFYDYEDDIVYFGDDNGYLYKVTPVLNSGTPTVTSYHLVTTEGTDTSVLTGVVYDYSSGYLFVGASNGEIYAVAASTFNSTAASYQFGDSSCSGGYNRRITDPPVVDSTNGWVYEQVTANTTSDTAVVQLSTSGPFTTENVVTVGQGDNGCNSATFFPTHSIEFDNNYYTGTTGSSGTIMYGHIWVCGRETGGVSASELWEIPTSTETGTSYIGSISGATAVANTSQINEVDHAQCSPFTEIENGTTDYLFFGEGLSGSFGRLYGFTLGDGSSTSESATEISGSPITEPTATGGTSAIVIDNVASSSTYPQASSIYFATQATSTTTCGTTSAYCAIKLTQSALQ
jgi:hypothetical protein